MYQQNATTSTSYQINTLLAYLKNQTSPPEGMLFFKPLIHANLDYTPDSIERLSHLLTQLQGYLIKKNLSLEVLVSQPQSRLFFLTVAGYLGEYLAQSCDESLIWYSYFEARTEIEKKNRAYGTSFRLEQAFENSVVAKIGDNMYCQPLQAVQQHLAGEGSISEFVAHMKQGIFEQAQVNIMAEPNQVCRAYLQKVQTGRLLDSTLGFFEQLKALTFDYSVASLAELDNILAQIKAQYHLTPDNYQRLIAEPAHQATLYLLGFYIGTTCATVTHTPIIWANYQQIYRTLIYANPNAKLVDSIEHSFVMVLENGQDKRFVTPILVVTQALFGIANLDNHESVVPNTSMAFYHAFEQNFATKQPAELHYFPYPPSAEATELNKLWQVAIEATSRLVINNLMQIFDGNELEGQVFEIDPVTKKGSIQPLSSLGKISSPNYFKQNPKQSPVLVATHDTLINLPTGQCDGIALDIAVYQAPKLRLRLVLPYRPADSRSGFAIYPLIMTKILAQTGENLSQDALLVSLIAQFYQRVTAFVSPMHEGSFWQNYYIEPVNSPKKSPLQSQIHTQQAEKITLSLLPVAPLQAISEPMVEPIIEPKTEPALASKAVQATAVPQPVLPEPAPTQAIALQQQTQPVTPITNPTINQFYNQNSAPLVTPEPSYPTPIATEAAPLPQKAQISPELLAQLQQNQERLQNQLTKSDSETNRKIIMMVISMSIFVLFFLLKAWLKPS